MNSTASFIPDDIHICGACRKQFSDVEEFVLHKKHGCPVLLSLQSGNQPGVSQSTVSSDSLPPGGNQVMQTAAPFGVSQSTVSSDSLPPGNQVMQTTKESGVSQSTVSSYSLPGNQVMQTATESGVSQSTGSSNNLPGNQVIQTATVSGVSQSTVSGHSQGNQVLQSGSNSFTIPQPNAHAQGTYGNHQISGNRQDVGGEDQYQVQQVSSTEEVGAYDHVTGTGMQTGQNGEYNEFAGGAVVLQQPLGHEYVRTQHRGNRYYLEAQEDQILQEPALPEVQSEEASSTDMMTGSHVVISQYQSIQPEQVNQSEETSSTDMMSGSQVVISQYHSIQPEQVNQSEEASSTDMMTGSQVVISQYQPIQPEYVLQQVNQSEEVYDERLVSMEVQSSLPPEPVYTLESHDEPQMDQSRGPPQANYIESNAVESIGDRETELINLTPASMDVSSATNSLSFESQLPGTFSLHNSGAGKKVFQQQIPSGQAYSHMSENSFNSQIPDVVNEVAQVPFVVDDASHATANNCDAHQTSSAPSQPQQNVLNKTPPRPVVLTRILTSPAVRRETSKLQQDKLAKKLPTRDIKPGVTTKTAPEKKFSCNYEYCGYRTAYMKDLERHYRTHTGEKPFTCATCGKSFNRNDKLILHMRYHSGEKSFKCQLCDYSCVENGSLKKHMRIHTEERPFKCQVCPYSSRSSGQLQIHLRSHTGDKPYICAACGAAFKVTSDLKRHMRVHTGEKPYACEHCDYRCSVKSNLKSHMKVNHSSKHEIECSACDFKSSSKKALREHFKLHEIKDELTCKECSYQCASKSALKNHMLKHNEDCLVKCNYCDYKTRHAGNVVSHMKRKHPSRMLQRKKVGRIYRRHNKGHAPYSEEEEGGMETSSKVKAKCKKTFKCDMCDNSFVREDSLKCHLKQHRDLSKSSLSTAYAVLKLQQPVINTCIDGNWRDDNGHSTETMDLTKTFIPAGDIAGVQAQPRSDTAINRTGQGQAEASSSQGQAPNLGIKDILAAAGINNGSKDTSPRAATSFSPTLNSGSVVTSAETVQSNLIPNIRIAQSPQEVPTVQVMQNISLPYIRLPDGQILVLGQSPLGQATPVLDRSPRKTTTNIAPDSPSEQQYPVSLQQVQTIPIPQQITMPVSASQPGAIPIQIIVPSDSQHSMPLVTQLLNSSLSTGQNPSNKQSSQTGSTDQAQNYVVHIPGNPGNLIKTSGSLEEGQSQSYVLQIPGSGPTFGITTPDLQQNLVSQGSEQVVQLVQDQGSEDETVSSMS